MNLASRGFGNEAVRSLYHDFAGFAAKRADHLNRLGVHWFTGLPLVVTHAKQDLVAKFLFRKSAPGDHCGRV